MDRDDIKQEDMNKLFPLSEIDDLEVADNDPDVRGWEVYGADGTRIGEVEELIVNPAQMKVRYLDVELDKNISELNIDDDDERHIAVPIGRATIDDEKDRIILTGVQVSGLREYPVFTGDFSREYEGRVINAYENFGDDRGTTGSRINESNNRETGITNRNDDVLPPTAKHEKDMIPDEEFYKRKDFDENQFYNSRRKNSGFDNSNGALKRRGE